jgi:hypothetical protein
MYFILSALCSVVEYSAHHYYWYHILVLLVLLLLRRVAIEVGARDAGRCT